MKSKSCPNGIKYEEFMSCGIRRMKVIYTNFPCFLNENPKSQILFTSQNKYFITKINVFDISIETYFRTIQFFYSIHFFFYIY